MIMQDHHRFYDGMMDGFGVFGLFWILIWLVLLVGGVIIISMIIKNNNKNRSYSQSSTALKILKERFARGEIDENEYRARKEILKEDDKS